MTKSIILGICNIDAYSSGLKFVFGQASLTGDVAAIYLPRLRQEFYGLAADRSIFIERVLKEATHEVGHALGLDHCPKQSCVITLATRLSTLTEKQRISATYAETNCIRIKWSFWQMLTRLFDRAFAPSLLYFQLADDKLIV
jgi:predicted Zn-dependent protease